MTRFLALLLLLAWPVPAEEVVADLSQNRISITADFAGSEILIFGAIKREAPIDRTSPLGVVITVAGPQTPVVVRRKSRVAGIWVNSSAVEVDAAPSFYAVATSGPLFDVLSHVENLRYRITPQRTVRSVGAPSGIIDTFAFTDALIRIRTDAGLYQVNEGGVTLMEDTLFRSSIALPSNLVEGNYTVDIYLTREGEVTSRHETVIFVRKVGLERFLYTLAHEQPLIYGLMSLAIAIAAGWGASAIFRYLRS